MNRSKGATERRGCAIDLKILRACSSPLDNGCERDRLSQVTSGMTRHLAMMWLIYAAICGALFIVEGKREQPSSMNHTDAPLTNAVSPPQVRLLDSD
jgi:hypothetical protein